MSQNGNGKTTTHSSWARGNTPYVVVEQASATVPLFSAQPGLPITNVHPTEGIGQAQRGKLQGSTHRGILGTRTIDNSTVRLARSDVHRMVGTMANSKLAKASKGTQATGKVKAKDAPVVKAKTNGTTLGKDVLALGKRLWSDWRTSKVFEQLGIRAKTALGLKDGKAQGGTRSAMLTVAAYGYENHAEAKLLTYAVRQAQGNTAIVGGIDFPWLEKAGNIETITSTASVRPDAKDGKMRLLVKTGTGKAKASARKVAGKPAVEPKRKGAADSRNGPVTTIKPPKPPKAKANATTGVVEQLATLQATTAQE